MRLLVTGVAGFLGAELRRHFEQHGHEVVGTTTRPALGAPGRFVHRLGEPVEPRWLHGVDVLVHAAWDVSAGASARNLAGTAAWREAAAASGAFALFISSYSAHPDFPTAYGRDKATAEAVFEGSGACTLRPALVVGPGGVFARLVESVQKSLLMALPDGGRYPVELVDVADVADVVLRCARERRQGAHDLSAGRLPLRQVCTAIASALGRRSPAIVPVPLRPVLAVLGALGGQPRAAELRDRVLGYVENGRRVRRSTLAELLGRAPIEPLESVSSHAPRAVLGTGAP